MIHWKPQIHSMKMAVWVGLTCSNSLQLRCRHLNFMNLLISNSNISGFIHMSASFIIGLYFPDVECQTVPGQYLLGFIYHLCSSVIIVLCFRCFVCALGGFLAGLGGQDLSPGWRQEPFISSRLSVDACFNWLHVGDVRFSTISIKRH